MEVAKIPARAYTIKAKAYPGSLSTLFLPSNNGSSLSIINTYPGKTFNGFKFYQRQVYLVTHGMRTKAVVLAVEDSGKKIYRQPVVLLTIRFQHHPNQPMEITAKTIVPAIAFPQTADNIMVAYDLNDLSVIAVL